MQILNSNRYPKYFMLSAKNIASASRTRSNGYSADFQRFVYRHIHISIPFEHSFPSSFYDLSAFFKAQCRKKDELFYLSGILSTPSTA